MDRRRLSAYANFIGLSDKTARFNHLNNEQRRLSDGPYPSSVRSAHNQVNHQEKFLHEESSCSLKEKNSSLTTLIDSTSSMMKTASSTFQNLISGSTRRASYCGEPDPTVQLSADGQCGSLYLINKTSTNSTDSFSSNKSIDEQKRTVTIYDGRIPSTPIAPTIPFELMTPIDVITKTIEDPVESFVQIVLEEPDERPKIIRRLSNSSPSPRRRRSLSPRNCQNQILSNSQPEQKNETNISNEIFDLLQIRCQPPELVEPMDFSFLEPVLCAENSSTNDEHFTVDSERLTVPPIE